MNLLRTSDNRRAHIRYAMRGFQNDRRFVAHRFAHTASSGELVETFLDTARRATL
jgi:hypothetical protein